MTSPGSVGVAGPNLTLTNSDGTCSAGGSCNSYTLNDGEEIQVNLTAGNGYWTELPASTDSSVLALQSESSDSSGDATALFKVVGPGTAELTAGSCPTEPPAGTACTSSLQSWQVAIRGTLAAAMAMSVSPTRSIYGQPVTLDAYFAFGPGANPVPTGPVEFYDGSTQIGTADLRNMDPNGDHAIMTTSTLAGGTHELSAVYQGDQVFSGSNTVPVFLSVDPAPTQMSATPALAQVTAGNLYAFALSATLTRSDTGVHLAGQKVNFSAGSTSICSPITDDQGVATCNGLLNASSILLNRGYTVTFPGTPDYRTSSAQAPLTS